MALKSAEFVILAVLCDGTLHDSGIMQAVYRKTSGGLMLRSTSLYGILRGLENRGLIQSTLKREVQPGATRGRTYYEITHLGREVVRAEADVKAKRK